MSSRPDLSRRSLLRAAGASGLALGAGGLLSACGSSDSSGSESGAAGAKSATVKVALGWIKNVEFAGFWLADYKGYYAEENLTVQFQAGGPNTPDPTQSVSAGSADLGVHANMQTLLQSIPKGNDFSLLGAVFQTSPGGLLSLAADPVTEPKDLLGAKVLGQQGTQPLIDAVLTRAGLKKDYSFTPVGYDVSPLVQKQGKAYTCFLTNQPITLETKYGMKKGKDYDVVTYADLGLPAYSSIVFCKRSMLRKQADVLERFLRATVRGWQDNAKDPEAAAKLAVTKYGVDLGLDLKQQVRENELQIPFTQSALTKRKGLLRLDEKLLAGDMYGGLKAAGVKELPDASKIVDQSVLDAVFGGKATV
ncbi:ABC transporter substrate-binding protein [Streptomyces sp. NPDC002896]|uniref:ABC transporter substrate-binding protein n=1 Tax=Streptomyces sp. NPDC002896 TaxID=3154438 RepID=UPI0033316326